MAISLALHLLLLWPDHGGAHRRPEADLTVRLVAPEPSSSAATRTLPQRGQRAAEPAASAALPVIAASAAEVAVPAPALAPPTGDGALAEGMRQYRFALALAARPFKPDTTAVQGGTAEVRVAVGAGGSVDNVALLTSSGHGRLDAVALAMVRGAAGQAEVPDALRSRAFAVDLPVIFSPDGE